MGGFQRGLVEGGPTLNVNVIVPWAGVLGLSKNDRGEKAVKY